MSMATIDAHGYVICSPHCTHYLYYSASFPFFAKGFCVILYDDICVRLGILYNVSAWGLRVARSDKMGNSQEPQDVGRARDTGLTFFLYIMVIARINTFSAESGDL